MKNLKITVNGKAYDVTVEEVDSSEEVVSTESIKESTNTKPSTKEEVTFSAGEETVKSPMPGTIVSINVTEGQKVSSGDVLLILEAMKMENEIVAPKNAVVSKIAVSKGQSVDSETVLLSLK